MKIMRTFLSGKIYKIVPVLLKFKISFFSSFSCFPPSFSFPGFSSFSYSSTALLPALMSTRIHLNCVCMCGCLGPGPSCQLNQQSLIPLSPLTHTSVYTQKGWAHTHTHTLFLIALGGSRISAQTYSRTHKYTPLRQTDNGPYPKTKTISVRQQ